jgi:hypothetical protein
MFMRGCELARPVLIRHLHRSKYEGKGVVPKEPLQICRSHK